MHPHERWFELYVHDRRERLVREAELRRRLPRPEAGWRDRLADALRALANRVEAPRTLSPR